MTFNNIGYLRISNITDDEFLDITDRYSVEYFRNKEDEYFIFYNKKEMIEFLEGLEG